MRKTIYLPSFCDRCSQASCRSIWEGASGIRWPSEGLLRGCHVKHKVGRRHSDANKLSHSQRTLCAVVGAEEDKSIIQFTSFA
jgi:hypothetical protein